MTVEEGLRQELLSKQKEIEKLQGLLSEKDASLWELTEEVRRMRFELTAKRSLLDAVLAQLPAGVIIGEAPSGRLTLMNRQAGEIWRGSFISSRGTAHNGSHKGFHPDGRPYETKEWPLARSILTGEIVRDEEIQFLRGDGTRGTISASSSPLRDSEGRIIAAVMVFYDITGRKLMEETLRRSEEECRLIFDRAPIGAAIVGLDHRFELVNDALCRITGYSKAELLSLFVMDITHPDDIASEIAYARRLQTGEIDHFQREKRYIRKDGKIVWTNLHARLLREVDGLPLYYLRMIEDITERKEAEEALRKAHGELDQRVRERTAELSIANENLKNYALRLELANQELQEFTYVATHHLQEPLRKLQVIGSLIRKKFADSLDEEGEDFLTRMINSANRMQSLISDLLKYSHLALDLEPFHMIDLSLPAREAFTDLLPLIRESGGSVEISQMPIAEVSPFHMRQLFENLISNALKYRSKKRPVIRIYGKTYPEGSCQVFVKDNGIGFEEIYLDQIFRPFQRLHGRDAFSGTGMGLAICRKIVEHHSGSITARSSPGKGSTFIVTLPVKQRHGELKSEGIRQGSEALDRPIILSS